MKVGAKIKSIRIEKGLKQTELASMAGISNTYLSDIENGRTNPSVNTIEKLAKALEINLDWDVFLESDYVKTEHTA